MKVLLVIIFLINSLFLTIESRAQENPSTKEINEKKITKSKAFKPSEEISKDNNIDLPSDI